MYLKYEFLKLMVVDQAYSDSSAIVNADNESNSLSRLLSSNEFHFFLILEKVIGSVDNHV